MVLEKVTAFVVRMGKSGPELLVFRHPTAGYQLPAGTVEPGEAPEQAVVREVLEETGLAVRVVRRIGTEDKPARPGSGYLRSSEVRLRFAPRDDAILEGRMLPSCLVQLGERRDGYIRIHYREMDLNREPPSVLWEVEGWAPENEIAPATRRYFFQVEAPGEAPTEWDHLADLGHVFHLFWARMDELPLLIGEQNDWLRWLV